MKICIFGADGRTGIEVLKSAKRHGFEIKAFVYSKGKADFAEDGIEIVKGDVQNYDQVLQACMNVDAVISTIGHIKGSDPKMQTNGTANIVKAMRENNVSRIISLTGTGVRIDGDKPSIIDIILNFFVQIVDPNRVADGIGHAKVLQNSGLDWTIVRVLKLGNSQKAISKYELTNGGPAELLTSRKKVAEAMVSLVNDKNYIGKMPVISK